MPLPLFLPCAAGVEPLLATEIRTLLPQAEVVEARGGVALVGEPFEVMALNLESRLAQRVLIEVGAVLAALGRSAADLTGEAAATYRALLVLGNGFILTAVLWATALVFIVERRLPGAALVFGLGGLATLCGLVHSPLPGGAVFWPWSASAPLATAAPLAGAYAALATLALLAAARTR